MAKKATKKKATTAKKKTTAKRTTRKQPRATKKSSTTKKKATKAKTAKRSTAKTTRKTTAKKAASSNASVKLPTQAINEKQTKSQIFTEISENTGLSKADVKKVFESLQNIVERHMKPKGSGQIIVPDLGVKIRRVQKKATKARMGRNPFTGEEIRIPAKPARKAVRATALKALKELA